MNEQVKNFIGKNWKWLITLLIGVGTLIATVDQLKKKTDENTNYINRLIDLHLK